MNVMDGTWTKAWFPWASMAALLLWCGAPALGADSEAANRQYNVAVGLQNREAYDLAVDAWTSFLQTYPNDSSANQARHYQGVCYFFLAVDAAGKRQTEAAVKAFDAAERSFKAVAAVPQFPLLEDTYLYLGLSQFKRAKTGSGGNAASPEETARQYTAAAATFDSLLKAYPQGKNLCKYCTRGATAPINLAEKPRPCGSTRKPSRNRPNEKLEPAIMQDLGATQQELKQWEAAGKTYDDFLKKYLDQRSRQRGHHATGRNAVPARMYQPAAEWFAAAAARPDLRIGRFRHHAAGRGPGETRQARRGGRYSGRDLHEVPRLDEALHRTEDC